MKITRDITVNQVVKVTPPKAEEVIEDNTIQESEEESSKKTKSKKNP